MNSHNEINKPLFSVIIPIFNKGEYLQECIKSVLNQSVGFKKHIELILVNDGSTDRSKDICEHIKSSYPNNTVYIEQANKGAAAARNAGLSKAKGQIISFIDADDFISKESFSAAKNYFSSAPAAVDVAIIQTVYFGSKTTPRGISKKFKNGTRTADLNNPAWYDVCPRVAPSFIRATSAKAHMFLKDVKFFEDTEYISKIISRSMLLGIISKGRYYYRRYDSSTPHKSIIAAATKDSGFYLDFSEKILPRLLGEGALNKDSNQLAIPLYFQYLALYEMRWRTFYNLDSPKGILSFEEHILYKELVAKTIALVSDEAIMAFNLYNYWQKVYILNLKHNRSIIDEASFDSRGNLCWENHTIFQPSSDLRVVITDLQIGDGLLSLEGFFSGFLMDKIEVIALNNGTKCNVLDLTKEPASFTDYHLGHPFYKCKSFLLKTTLDHKTNVITFAYSYNGVRGFVKGIYSSKKASKEAKGKEAFGSLLYEAGGFIARRYVSRIVITKSTLLNRAKFKMGIFARQIRRKLRLLVTRHP